MLQSRVLSGGGIPQSGARKSGSAAIHLRHDPRARLRLFCLPYAGGGASLFHPWSRVLPREIQVCPIQLPGRENRLREPPHRRLTDLVLEVADAMAPLLDLPYALFGHSMGAAVAFEAARELRRRKTPLPAHLFVSAFRAPHRPPSLPPLAALPPPMFLAAVQQRYGAFEETVLAEPALMEVVIPVLRADLALIETYRCEEDAPLECPITVFGGAEDRTVSRADVEEWRRHTAGAFEVCVVPGGHFFLKESREGVLGEVRGRLGQGC